MKLYELIDKADLDRALEERLVNARKSGDGQTIYNYSDAAMFTPGSWDNPAVRECRGLIVDDATLEIVARPWRKFFNHSQPEAGELDMFAPVEVTDKKDGCFSNKTRLNLWGGGTITIGEVVKNKLTPTLIGMNADGDLVPSRVTNWFDNGLKDNWLRVGLSTPASSKSGAAGFPNRMFVTPNHQVLHEEKYVPIGSLNVGDSLTSYTKSFSGLDLFLGGLLGDGSVCRNGNGANYQECHGESQRAYVEEQKALFSEGLVNREDTRGGYANSPKVWLGTQNAQVFEDLRNEWYPEGTKRVPCDLSFMNDAVVAKWFMDDGNRTHSPLQQDRAVFYTNGFVEEDVRRLAAWLEAEYGVTAKVFNSKGWSIRLNYANGTINKFWEAVAPYTFPSMEYKLPEKYRGKFSGFPSPKMVLLPVESFVTSMEEGAKWQENNYGRARTRAFDIETETHNYMCQGVLVHNSLGIIHLDSSGQVRVASRGSFESDQAIWATKWINKNWPFVRDKHDPTLYWALKNFTYLVEIIYPSNRIVCDYGDYEGLVLLGSVDIKHGFYFSPIESAFELWSGDVTEVFPFTTLKEALEAPPRNGAEGLCVRFLKEAKIVKIKQEDYVRLHKIVTGLSEKSVWEHMVNGGVLPELLAPLPDELHDWARRVYLDLQADIYSIKQGVEAVFRQVKERLPEDAQRSAFAEEFKRAPSITSLLFMRLDNKDLTPAILKMLKPRGDSKAKTFSEETA